jgi:hypothetical protein
MLWVLLYSGCVSVCCGCCCIVALNYQTADDPMIINGGFFLDNGNAGYVLKPSFMLDSKYIVFLPRVLHIVSLATLLNSEHV